jgi:deoxyribonuclease V
VEIKHLHSWNVSSREATEIQNKLRKLLNFRKLPRTVRYVAGTDVSCSKKSNTIWAGVLVLTYPQLVIKEKRWIRGKANFPYIPGLLSFRELPALLEAIKRVETEPDLIICDGQGIAHPRGLGLASHLGLLIDKPTVGCAKSRLVGEFSEVGEARGDYANLCHNGRVMGVVLRTRTGVKPLFVSPGNKITLEESMKIVLSCCVQYRIPEPTRQSHLLVTALRRREGIGQ